MSDLEERIRNVLVEDASRAPLVSGMPDRIRPRIRRRQAATTVVASIAAVALIAGSVFVVGVLDPERTSIGSGPDGTVGATPIPVDDGPLPVDLEPGTYRVPASGSSASYTVTFPAGWSVQGGRYLKHSGGDDELFLYGTSVEEVYTDACAGEGGDATTVGPGANGLPAALLRQAGTRSNGPISTTLGGHPATRIDLAIPSGFDPSACALGAVGLQVWRSGPDDYFVLLADGTASVYVVDVGGRRQIFVSHTRSATPDEDVQELRAIVNSIRFET